MRGDKRETICGGNDWTLDTLDYDARENLLGFYELLLKIRMRNDRKKYGEKKEDKC